MKLFYTTSKNIYQVVNVDKMKNASHTFHKKTSNNYYSRPLSNVFVHMVFVFLMITIPFFTIVLSIQESIKSKVLLKVKQENQEQQTYSAAKAKENTLTMPMLGN